MLLGTVIGRVTLSQQEPVYRGCCLLLVQPFSRLQFSDTSSPSFSFGSTIVVYDQLGAGEGDTIGFTEGAEASQPFPIPAPVDAFAACIVEHIDYRPPA
ncbi:MAG: ethanolamine utilization protein EutN [Candidatus Synoicihabitans palmerolidicus]|nr:ethanolamine utilization protein EutN [Candidatus Synoicihabitans palmerolidicus]